MPPDRPQRPEDAGARLPNGTLVDRYQVLEILGEGGMGVVYLAHDPQLDRRVALKLVRPERANAAEGEQLRLRISREAQAMARLSHPSVIHVFDVGAFAGQVFVAMELIEGGRTLAAWLLEEPRSWREVLDLFLQAGRGLQAAHAAGIVHRDFKPQNVLVDKRGAARVTDFGLARLAGQEEPPTNSSSETAWTTPAVTLSSGIIGTPGYIAPEQMRGEASDARADQFSFSVALYQALYGEPPFAGRDLRTLADEIAQGNVRYEPEGTRVPAWVRKVLLRGLAARPDERHPSLKAMLDALEADPNTRWRTAGAGLGVVALIAGAALFARWQSDPVCRGAEEKLAGVWDAALREKGQHAFSAAKLSYANASWALAEKALDRYAADWTAMRTDACKATSVRHEQSPELLDLRISCLDDRLRSLGAASALFSTADNEVISSAVNVVSGLPALSECANEASLRAPGAPTPLQRPLVDALRERLSRALVLADAGKPPVAVAKQINEEARKVGYAPLQAEVLHALARFEQLSGDIKAARETQAAAAAAALGAKSDLLLADAWISLLDIDVELEQFEAAANAANQAQAAVTRAGSSPRQEGSLLSLLAALARNKNQLEEATADDEQAVALLEKPPVNPWLLAVALDDLAATLATRAHWPEALEVQRRALATAIAAYGPDHPTSGRIEQQLGAMLNEREHGAEARQHLEHALAVLENALGKDNLRLADVLTYLGDNCSDSDPERAIAYLRRALHVEGADSGAENSGIVHSRLVLGIALEQVKQEKAARKELEDALSMESRVAHDPDDILAALVKTELGNVLIHEGDLKAARPLLEGALATQKKAYGEEHPAIGDTEFQLAQVAQGQHQLATARRFAEQSLAQALLDTPEGSEASIVREMLVAEIRIAQGEGKQARPSLERIVATPESGPGSIDFDRSRARALLAEDLWPDKSERPRALRLAHLALEELKARGDGGINERAQLQRWLETHH